MTVRAAAPPRPMNWEDLPAICRAADWAAFFEVKPGQIRRLVGQLKFPQPRMRGRWDRDQVRAWWTQGAPRLDIRQPRLRRVNA